MVKKNSRFVANTFKLRSGSSSGPLEWNIISQDLISIDCIMMLYFVIIIICCAYNAQLIPSNWHLNAQK